MKIQEFKNSLKGLNIYKLVEERESKNLKTD